MTVRLNEDTSVRDLRANGPPQLLLLSRARQARELNNVYELQRIGRFGANDDSAFDLYLGEKASQPGA